MSEGRDASGRWEPGRSGNPGGRPSSQSLNAAIRARLDERREDGITRAERIAQILVDMAEQGDLRAIREVIDRAEGRPNQAVALESNATIELLPITFTRRD